MELNWKEKKKEGRTQPNFIKARSGFAGVILISTALAKLWQVTGDFPPFESALLVATFFLVIENSSAIGNGYPASARAALGSGVVDADNQLDGFSMEHKLDPPLPLRTRHLD